MKLVVVGDGAVGKTCLLMSYLHGKFDDQYIPTVFENYSVGLTVKGVVHQLQLCDTSGQEDYSRLRPLAYPKTDIFLICASVVMSNSFVNVKHNWLPELKHHCPSVPFILVGTQTDLRNDKEHLHTMKDEPMTREGGEKLARKIGAVKYLECSAKAQIGVKELFEDALITALNRPTQVKKKQCVLL